MKRLILALMFVVPALGIQQRTYAQTTAKKPAATPPATPKTAAPAAKAGSVPQPQLIMETSKGIITMVLFPDTAPKSVEHILKLVNTGFYRSQRIHRVVAGQIVQWGDKRSRDMTQREWWGRGTEGGSGTPIGVAEISAKHLHTRGAVGLAHMGDPRGADSQIYITTSARPNLDGKYTVIGQVTSGMDVVIKLKVEDEIKNITAKGVPGT
jgi:peptidylprolyl isomerase